jgi:hypothetical protein
VIFRQTVPREVLFHLAISKHVADLLRVHRVAELM